FPPPAPAPSATYPLSLHDALPICQRLHARRAAERQLPQLLYPLRVLADLGRAPAAGSARVARVPPARRRAAAMHVLRAEMIYLTDRKSTRLNSSHVAISYAVFCLK